MAITNGYATLAEFKAYMVARGIAASTDTNDDAVIEDIIEAVSRYIDGQTGRRFYANDADETRYYTGADDTMSVRTDDIKSITSVSVNYDGYLTTYTTLTLTTDYLTLPDNAALDGMPITELVIAPLSSAYFPNWRRGVKIIGDFGFPAVPDNVKTDCLAIALNIYQSRTGQGGAGTATVTAAGVVIRPNDVPAWAHSDLMRYRDIT